MTLEVGKKHLNRFDKDFCLSDKIKEIGLTPSIHVHDVKMFIEKLIAKFKRMEIVSGDVIEFEIKQLAGSKLI